MTSLLTVLLLAPALVAQTEKAKETEAGFPVTNAVTKAKCGGCHQADANGNLTRISWIRTTPEGWQEAIKRMVRLNGVKLTPAEAREIVQYLGTHHGLAPEEAAPHSWYAEMRHVESEPLPSDPIREACASCHPLARPSSWRRSANEWQELVNMHLGYFPVVEYNGFRRRPRANRGQPSTTPPAQPERDPADLAIEHFRKSNPLHTTEWAQWRAAMREPKLAGSWAVFATQPGKGKFYGQTEITAGANPAEFTTRTKLTSISTGQTMEFTGKVLVYTGYQWRGRSSGAGIDAMREVMMVSRDQASIQGRWFWGAYQEFGFQVRMQRAADVTVLGTDTFAIQSGKPARLRIFGANLPANITPQDVDLGAGITIKKVMRTSPSVLDVEADVAATAIAGPRDAVVRRVVAPAAFAVYDKVDYIRTATDSQLARLGGNTHPKGFVQFEAIGFHRGPDGKVKTADDVNLGPVPVRWSIEEFHARHNDDDKDFVGTINDNGLFTPASEGPNPKRRFLANNFGDVWVVANYGSAGAKEAMTAMSYLVVTVPMYVRWDQPEVAE